MNVVLYRTKQTAICDMNRRRFLRQFLIVSSGLFVPTIGRGINPVMIPRISDVKRISDLSLKTTKVGVWNPTITTAGLVPMFDYGDGTATELTKTPSHTYANAGTKVVNIYLRDSISKITQLDFNSKSLTGTFPRLSRFSGLTTSYFYTNSLSGAVGDYPLASSIIHYSGNNSVTSLPSNFSSLAAMTYMTAAFCGLSGTLPSLTALTSFVSMTLNDNYNISGWTTSTLALTFVTLLLQNNALTQSAVDKIAADFVVNLASRPTTGSINVGGSGNAAPSASGLIDYNAIAATGKTVTHN